MPTSWVPASQTGRYDYNAREWVTGIDYAAAFNSTLTYDRSGNVTRQVYRHGTAASKTADYAYDDLYRITGFDVSGGISQDYAYDRSGQYHQPDNGYQHAHLPLLVLLPAQPAGQHIRYRWHGVLLQPERMDDGKGHRYGELRLPRAHHRLRQHPVSHGPGQTAREEDGRDGRHLLPAGSRWRCFGRIRPQPDAIRQGTCTQAAGGSPG